MSLQVRAELWETFRPEFGPKMQSLEISYLFQFQVARNLGIVNATTTANRAKSEDFACLVFYRVDRDYTFIMLYFSRSV